MTGGRTVSVWWTLIQLTIGLVMLGLLASARSVIVLWSGLVVFGCALFLFGRFRQPDAKAVAVAERAGAPVVIAVFGLLFLWIFRNSPYALLIGAVASLYAVVAMANNLTTGLLGFVDISAAAVMGIGAYAGGAASAFTSLPPLLCLLVGAVAGMLIGGLLGMTTLRMRGNEVAMATLAATVVVHSVMVNTEGRLGGPDGFGGIAPWVSVLPIPGTPRRADFLAAFVLLFIVWLLLRNLRRSRFWRGWLALGDDEAAAVSCGVSPPRLVLLAFLVSGCLTGAAGAAYAHVQRYIAPGNFGLMESVMIVSAVMLGGRGGLAGPPMAAAVVWLLPEQLQIAPFARMLIFGVALLLLLRLRPQGLLPQQPLSYRETSRDGEKPRSREQAAEFTVRDLHYRIGDFVPVAGVNLSVRPGESLGLVGRNGSGKTLTLDMLSGFLKPSSGSVQLGEIRIDGRIPWKAAGTGIRRTFQESRLFRRLSVLEHAMVGAHTSGRVGIVASLLGLPSARREQGKLVARARAKLELFGPDRFGPRENDLAAAFSFGNRRRIEMARCLAAEPLYVLALDEPFVGIPPADVPGLCRMLREEMREGCIVVAEHDTSALDGLADRVLRIEQGKIVSEVPASGPA